jgi:hypothetical protein
VPHNLIFLFYLINKVTLANAKTFLVYEKFIIFLKVLQCLAYLGTVRPARYDGGKIDGIRLMVPDDTTVSL